MANIPLSSPAVSHFLFPLLDLITFSMDSSLAYLGWLLCGFLSGINRLSVAPLFPSFIQEAKAQEIQDKHMSQFAPNSGLYDRNIVRHGGESSMPIDEPP